jgi:hypothetical protein
MIFTVRTVEYFYTRVEEEPSRAYDFLARLASEEINLLAFSAVPFGPNHIELTIFPDRSDELQRVAKRLGWTLIGPQHACLVQGDDHLGALAEIHRRLLDSGVSIYASTGASFEAITYIDGRQFFEDVYKVSANGKVLTDIGTPEATKKPDTIILVRQ